MIFVEERLPKRAQLEIGIMVKVMPPCVYEWDTYEHTV